MRGARLQHRKAAPLHDASDETKPSTTRVTAARCACHASRAVCWRCGGLRARAGVGPAHADVGDVDDGRQRARGEGVAEGDAAEVAVRRGQPEAQSWVLAWGRSSFACRCACVRPSIVGGRARVPGCYARERRGCAWTYVASSAVASVGCSALVVRAHARSVHGHVRIGTSMSAHERGREDAGAGRAAQGGEECRYLLLLYTGQKAFWTRYYKH